MRMWRRIAMAMLALAVVAALAVTLRAIRGANAYGKAVVRPVYPTSAPSYGCGRWAIVQSPNVPGATNILNAVTALSANDVWTVGGTVYQGYTVVEHWDGTSWTIIPSPNVANMLNNLNGVAAVSPTDIWAVGQTNPLSGGMPSTLTEHWNGTSWTIVPSPNAGTQGSALNAVAAVSTTDVWAVGYLGIGYSGPLIEHWNGTSWSVVATNLAGSSLNGISAVSATDIWAVGNLNSGPLTLHWDGSSWKAVPNAPPNANYSGASSVAARASNDVWFAGFEQPVSGPNFSTLMEHWNGMTWSIVASPNSSLTQNLLHAITPVPGSNQLWAVGTATPMSGPSIALIERWNGSTWSLVNSPTLGQDGGFLSGVSAVSATDVWSVGGVNPFASLTEQYTPSRTLINCPKG
jgi:hypothetical protein